jgi:hypothetical protein
VLGQIENTPHEPVHCVGFERLGETGGVGESTAEDGAQLALRKLAL